MSAFGDAVEYSAVRSLAGVPDQGLRSAWRSAGWHGDTDVADMLRASARQYPHTRAVFATAEARVERSLAQIHHGAQRIAAGLRKLGLCPGDRIAIQLPNSLEAAAAYQAALLVGAVLVPVVHSYGASETGFILDESGARALILPDRWGAIDYRERLPLLRRSAALEHVVVVGDRVPPGALRWCDLDEANDRFAPTSMDPDDLALILYTSGTTAEPKGVQHTGNTLLATLRTADDPRPGQRPVSLAPFPSGHSAGLLGLLRLYAGGVDHVFMDRWNAALAAELIDRYCVTEGSGAPVMLGDLLHAAASGGRATTSLRSFLTGGASVPPPLVERADAAGLRPFRCYGSSEHPAISMGNVDDPIEARTQTDGRLTRGVEVRILDDDDRDLPNGRAGEIVTRGPRQFTGYRDAKLDAAAHLPGGWFRTGDIGRMDGDGRLTVVDRKKDIIIRGGENISSKEIEDLIARHPDVVEVAVVAGPHARMGEMVCAFVQVRDGGEVTLDSISDRFQAAGIARFKIPERLENVTDFPRTPAGKVKKVELRNFLAANAQTTTKLSNE